MMNCMVVTNFDNCCIQTVKFPQKLWKIVNDCKTGAILWSCNGNSILLEYKQFQDEYLEPKTSIFKTSNINSFIRQLNLYGFRKVNSHQRDPVCNSNNPNLQEFMHENFQANRPDLLKNVCRKMKIKKNKWDQKNKPNVVIHKSKEFRFPYNVEGMTKLQMCQFALKNALEQALSQYKQQKIAQSTSETEKSPSIDIDKENSTETALKFFVIDTPEESNEKSSSETETPESPETQEIIAEEIIYEIPESQFLVPVSETPQNYHEYYI